MRSICQTLSRCWNSLYARLLCGFLAVLIPIYVFGLTFFQNSTYALETEISNSAAANLQFLMSGIESQIVSVGTSLDDLIDSSSKIRAFLTRQNTYSVDEYWMELRAILRELKAIQKNHPLLSEILLYYPTLGISLSTKRGVHADEAASFAEDLAACLTKYPLMESNGELAVSRVFPLNQQIADGSQEPLIYAKALISDYSLISCFSALSGLTGQATLFYSNSAEHAVVSAGALPENDGLAELLPRLEPGENREFDVRRLNSDITCCTVYAREIDCYICQLLPMNEIYAVPRGLQRLLTLFMILSIPLFFAFAGVSMRLVKQPLDRLLRACDSVKGGDMNVSIAEKASSSEFRNLIMHFNEMIARIRQLIDTVYKQELYSKISELKQLQAQINPHFLYNSFFALRHMISYQENDNAEMLAEYLGNYFQYITHSGMQDASLREEYDHGVTYLRIQHMRFPDRLTLDIQPLDEEIASLRVPRLILQPIFENTIVHGLKASRRNGHVCFRSEYREGVVTCVIEDSGDGLGEEALEQLRKNLKDSAQEKYASGLVNIHRRLQLLFGADYGISVSRGAAGGLRVCMKFPGNR